METEFGSIPNAEEIAIRNSLLPGAELSLRAQLELVNRMRERLGMPPIALASGEVRKIGRPRKQLLLEPGQSIADAAATVNAAGRSLSAEARKRMSEATKRRWAKVKAEAASKKGGMTAAGRETMRRSMRHRLAQIDKLGFKSLPDYYKAFHAGKAPALTPYKQTKKAKAA